MRPPATPGSRAIQTLQDLLTDAGQAPFLTAFETKSCWHFPAPRAAQVRDLLAWETIEALVGGHLAARDRFRVVVNGNELTSTAYCDDAGRLLPEVVQDLAAQGATLAIDAIDELAPAIGRLSAAMERRLRCKIGANCYLSFGEASAFPAHCDAHDVLILQIYGAKQWRRFGVPFAYPMAGRRPTVVEPIWEGAMGPGDLLYLPRGEVHAATPVIRPSVHLTFGLYEPTGIDFINWLAVKARDMEPLRRGLGPTLSGEARTTRDKALKAGLVELLGAATVDEFFTEMDRERAPRPLAPLGMLLKTPSQLQLETLLISALRRRLDLAADQPGEALLALGKRRTRLSNLARRALAEITARERLTVASLARSLGAAPDDQDFIRALDELAGKSLIEIAD